MEFELQGAKFTNDRAILLAHGAGADMNTPALKAVADAAEVAGVTSLRFNFTYKEKGRKAPDRAPVLIDAVRRASEILAEKTGLPQSRIVLGGRSMGGRMCSLAVADKEDPLPGLGLLLLAYPIHPAGKPETLRVEHFPGITVPTLFISGTRDSLATKDTLMRESREIVGPTSLRWIENADHSYRVPKAMGRTESEILTQLSEWAVDFVMGLPAGK